MKRYEKHSKRQGARANHPKQTALPSAVRPEQTTLPVRPKQTAPLERRAPSAERPFFHSKQTFGGFITTRSFPIRPCFFFIKDQPIISHNIKLEPLKRKLFFYPTCWYLLFAQRNWLIICSNFQGVLYSQFINGIFMLKSQKITSPRSTRFLCKNLTDALRTKNGAREIFGCSAVSF